MQVMSFSAARQGLKAAMDEVCAAGEPLLITRQRGESVVMIALSDYNSLIETGYLLASDANAARLAESTAQIETFISGFGRANANADGSD